MWLWALACSVCFEGQPWSENGLREATQQRFLSRASATAVVIAYFSDKSFQCPLRSRSLGFVPMNTIRFSSVKAVRRIAARTGEVLSGKGCQVLYRADYRGQDGICCVADTNCTTLIFVPSHLQTFQLSSSPSDPSCYPPFLAPLCCYRFVVGLLSPPALFWFLDRYLIVTVCYGERKADMSYSVILLTPTINFFGIFFSTQSNLLTG